MLIPASGSRVRDGARGGAGDGVGSGAPTTALRITGVRRRSGDGVRTMERTGRVVATPKRRGGIARRRKRSVGLRLLPALEATGGNGRRGAPPGSGAGRTIVRLRRSAVAWGGGTRQCIAGRAAPTQGRTTRGTGTRGGGGIRAAESRGSKLCRRARLGLRLPPRQGDGGRQDQATKPRPVPSCGRPCTHPGRLSLRGPGVERLARQDHCPGCFSDVPSRIPDRRDGRGGQRSSQRIAHVQDARPLHRDGSSPTPTW